MPTLLYEIEHGRNNGVIVAGTDEAGRGPLAGPVVAAAVIIPQLIPPTLAAAINDSKQLSEKKRAALFPQIMAHCDVGIAECSVEEIDSLNILRASLLAMQRAVACLSSPPQVLLIDGNKSPDIPNMKNIPLVKGDSKSLSIAAASIVAKVSRDQIMRTLHKQHPYYGWDHNAGYPTAEHLAALADHGITEHHRLSFGPVRQFQTKTHI